MTIEHITDHSARALSRLIEQLKQSLSHQGMLSGLAVQVQEIEDAFQPLLLMLDIDASSGNQLDVLGGLLGVERTGRDDAQFRLRLKAQIIINKSSGTADNLADILELSVPGSNPNVQDDGEAAFLTIMNGVTISDPGETQSLVYQAKAAGVGAQVYYQPLSDALTFCMDGGPGLGFGDSTNAATGGGLAGQI